MRYLYLIATKLKFDSEKEWVPVSIDTPQIGQSYNSLSIYAFCSKKDAIDVLKNLRKPWDRDTGRQWKIFKFEQVI